jgi:hypothetical protein
LKKKEFPNNPDFSGDHAMLPHFQKNGVWYLPRLRERGYEII